MRTWIRKWRRRRFPELQANNAGRKLFPRWNHENYEMREKNRVLRGRWTIFMHFFRDLISKLMESLIYYNGVITICPETRQELLIWSRDKEWHSVGPDPKGKNSLFKSPVTEEYKQLIVGLTTSSPLGERIVYPEANHCPFRDGRKKATCLS